MTLTFLKTKSFLFNHKGIISFGLKSSKIKSTEFLSSIINPQRINTLLIWLIPGLNSNNLNNNCVLSYRHLLINSYSNGVPNQEDNLKIFKSHSNKHDSSLELNSTLIMEYLHNQIKSEFNSSLPQMLQIMSSTDFINSNTSLMYPFLGLLKQVKSNSNLFPSLKSTKEFNFNLISLEFVKECHKKLVKFIDKNPWNNNNSSKKDKSQLNSFLIKI